MASRMLKVLTLLILTGVTAGAYGKDGNGQFVLKGEGNATCAQFIDAATNSEPQLAGFGGFVNGYTSAYNQISDETFDVWPWQTIDTILLIALQRCRQSPDMQFGSVVMQLTQYLARNRLSQSAVLVDVKGTDGRRAFSLYAPVMEELKQRLEARGYNADDVYSGLMRFKNDIRAANTPNIIQVLLLRLFSENVSNG